MVDCSCSPREVKVVVDGSGCLKEMPGEVRKEGNPGRSCLLLDGGNDEDDEMDLEDDAERVSETDDVWAGDDCTPRVG
jgi:hypothetical protein